ncbi:hypothetical protein HII13_001727 [Brettanomyces bruxellensis]|nr:hypothetical protein HII13_001727 [Brettanomyces bruxellensis]
MTAVPPEGKFLTSRRAIALLLFVAFSIIPVLWAQRSNAKVDSKNIIFLKVRLVDPTDLKIDLKATSLDITAKSDGQDYSLHIDFYAEINEEESHYHYWPRLTKEKAKYHYIRTDFEKWVDEDEQESKPEAGNFDPSTMDLASLAKQYGGKGDPSKGSTGPSEYGDLSELAHSAAAKKE